MLDKINAIIFDFGGVLINIDYNATINAFKELGIENFEELYSQAQQSNLFDDIEVGKITDKEFINSIKQFLPSKVDSKAILNAWNKMIQNVPVESVELIKGLKKKGYKVYMLSNTNSIHINHAMDEWLKVSDQLPKDLFDAVYLSHEIHLRKPTSEVFEFICEQEGLNPTETLFVDDSIQHIEGAKKIGLKTLHLKKEMNLYELFS